MAPLRPLLSRFGEFEGILPPYGTELPTYTSSYSFSTGPNGDQVLDFKLSQSNVDSSFKMPVPVYLQLANGKIVRLGILRALGNETVSQRVPLGGVKVTPRALIPAYYHDVLGTFE